MKSRAHELKKPKMISPKMAQMAAAVKRPRSAVSVWVEMQWGRFRGFQEGMAFCTQADAHPGCGRGLLGARCRRSQPEVMRHASVNESVRLRFRLRARARGNACRGQRDRGPVDGGCESVVWVLVMRQCMNYEENPARRRTHASAKVQWS